MSANTSKTQIIQKKDEPENTHLKACLKKRNVYLFIGLSQDVGFTHLHTFSFGPSVILFLEDLIAFLFAKPGGNYSVIKHGTVIIPKAYT